MTTSSSSSSRPRVLISDKMDPLAAAVFEKAGCAVDVKPGMSPAELAACIGAYDGLAIRSATKVTKDILTAAKNLKVIGRAGIGGSYEFGLERVNHGWCITRMVVTKLWELGNRDLPARVLGNQSQTEV